MYKYTRESSKFSAGFSLIELIVVISILGILLTATLAVINPIAQIEKGQDARRLSDLKIIKDALGVYYHDFDCFPGINPAAANPPPVFGHEWKIGNIVYLNKTPQDPSGIGYRYYDDGSTCPQWNVLVAELSKQGASQNLCKLSATCMPSGIPAGKWACQTSGNVDCATLSSTPF